MNGQGHLIRAHETFEDLLKSNSVASRSYCLEKNSQKKAVFQTQLLTAIN
jgi:hypothetical protein